MWESQSICTAIGVCGSSAVTFKWPPTNMWSPECCWGTHTRSLSLSFFLNTQHTASLYSRAAIAETANADAQQISIYNGLCCCSVRSTVEATPHTHTFNNRSEWTFFFLYIYKTVLIEMSFQGVSFERSGKLLCDLFEIEVTHTHIYILNRNTPHYKRWCIVELLSMTLYDAPVVCECVQWHNMMCVCVCDSNT